MYVQYISDDEDALEAAKKAFDELEAEKREAEERRKLSGDKGKSELTSVSPSPSVASRGKSKKRSSSLEADSPKAATCYKRFHGTP